MVIVKFLWAKFVKKVRGSAVRNSFVHKTSKIEAGSSFISSSMSKHSFCGYNCDINYTEIGSYCSIANDVKIGGGAHPIDWVSTSPVFYEGRDSVKAKFSEHKRKPLLKTVIGNDVWIGQGVIIKQGVKVGSGAVVGMGSIVTKDVAPYSVVAGCPAIEIKKRFEAPVVNKLLEIKWWDFSDDELRKYAKYFQDPIEFIRQVSK